VLHPVHPPVHKFICTGTLEENKPVNQPVKSNAGSVNPAVSMNPEHEPGSEHKGS